MVSSWSEVEKLDDCTSGQEDDILSGRHRQKDDHYEGDDNDNDGDDDHDENHDDDYGRGDRHLSTGRLSSSEKSQYSTRPLATSSKRLHVTAEKRYSSSVRCKIKTLHNIISSCETRHGGVVGDANFPAAVPEKLSKAAILGKAIEHIEKLVSTYEYYESRHERLLGMSERCLAALEQ